MVAGYDRYVQVARCFRDEDLRADRQPEFTQLDVEMSFIDAEDIIGVIDGLVARLAKEILGLEVPLPLPRMCYDEAMGRFGHDAPDLRFGMELIDVGDLAARVGVQGVPRGGRGRRPGPRHQRQGGRRPLLPQGHRRADQPTSSRTSAPRGWCSSRSRPTASWPRPAPRTSAPSCSPRSAGGWTPRRATCCCWWPTSSRPPARPCTACGSGWGRS